MLSKCFQKLQRLEEQQLSTEDAYFRKLQLLTSSSERSHGVASARAHEDQMNMIRKMEAREEQAKRSLELLRNELATAQAAILDSQAELTALREGEDHADAKELEKLKAQLLHETAARQVRM